MDFSDFGQVMAAVCSHFPMNPQSHRAERRVWINSLPSFRPRMREFLFHRDSENTEFHILRYSIFCDIAMPPKRKGVAMPRKGAQDEKNARRAVKASEVKPAAAQPRPSKGAGQHVHVAQDGAWVPVSAAEAASRRTAAGEKSRVGNRSPPKASAGSKRGKEATPQGDAGSTAAQPSPGAWRQAKRPTVRPSPTRAAGVGALAAAANDAAQAHTSFVDAAFDQRDPVATRSRACEVQQQLEAKRREYDAALDSLWSAASERDAKLRAVLANPIDAFRGEAVWQVCMADYAMSPPARSLSRHSQCRQSPALSGCPRDSARGPRRVPRSVVGFRLCSS